MFGMVNFGSIITDVEREQQQIGIEFVKLTTWNQDGLFRTIDPEQIDNTIIIPVNGQYNVSFTASFKGTNERVYTLSLFQDGVEVPEIQATRFFGPNLKTGDMSFEGVINVTSAPSTIDVRVKCNVSEANVVIVQNAILSCFELPPAPTTFQDISCKVTKSTDQTIPTGVHTPITWDTENYDTNDMHNTVTNNSRITIKTAGKYLLVGQTTWTSNSGGSRRDSKFLKNGVDDIARLRYEPITSIMHIICIIVFCVPSDRCVYTRWNSLVR